MPKPLLVAAVVLGATAIAVAITGESRIAEAKCWPNRVNDGLTYHDGRYRHPATGPTAVTSYILNYSPWVQPGSGVVAWSMLTRTPGPLRWAQIGWEEWAYDERFTFVQYTPVDINNGVTTARFPARPLGVSSEYKVLKRGNAFQFYADGISYGAGTVNWTPNEARLSGEIKTLASQMPGGYNNSEWFSLSYIELGVGAWDSFDGAAAPVPLDPHFGQQIYSWYQQRIWDWACPQ